jgi:thiol-disulfide isomerase/thioredoxin
VVPIPGVVGGALAGHREAKLVRSSDRRKTLKPLLQKNSSKAQTNTKAVYADWCAPCHQIAPVYEKLSEVLSRPNKVTFTKVNVDQQTAVAQRYGVTAYATTRHPSLPSD